eukprot:jgi/Undpi1/11926/HiC_scaffold_4.g01625.m1
MALPSERLLYLQADGRGVLFSANLYKWDRTSPRMASFVYEEIVAKGVRGSDVKVEQKLALHNDLFNFSRIAVTTLMDCPPPDLLYGPSSKGMPQQRQQQQQQQQQQTRTTIGQRRLARLFLIRGAPQLERRLCSIQAMGVARWIEVSFFFNVGLG